MSDDYDLNTKGGSVKDIEWRETGTRDDNRWTVYGSFPEVRTTGIP